MHMHAIDFTCCCCYAYWCARKRQLGHKVRIQVSSASEFQQVNAKICACERSDFNCQARCVYVLYVSSGCVRMQHATHALRVRHFGIRGTCQRVAAAIIINSQQQAADQRHHFGRPPQRAMKAESARRHQYHITAIALVPPELELARTFACNLGRH